MLRRSEAGASRVCPLVLAPTLSLPLPPRAGRCEGDTFLWGAGRVVVTRSVTGSSLSSGMVGWPGSRAGLPGEVL